MADFDFYINIYGGLSIPADEWEFYASRAQDQLARYKQIYCVHPICTDGEKMAICAMADTLAYFTAIQNGSAGAVSSASIGSVSVSYGGTADSVDMSAKGQARELLRCARLYLDIYRGVGGC